MKFSSSSIMAAAEQKPDTDQRILDLNLTDQGYRVGACGCCCRHQVFGPSERGGATAERICSAWSPRAVKGRPQLFLSTVKWITYGREIPGHYALYRAAQADFNVRGWQGCWRYTAPTALFFSGRPDPPTSPGKPP
jgi:hypothetical protein